MHLYCCIVVGRWKLENWHLYHYRQHCDNKTERNKFWLWDKVI